MYKPIKVICTDKDPKKRKTIFDILPRNLPRLISIGRLDFMSEGLILLTNNGDFARKMELPSSNILRVYRVCIKGKVSEDVINKIKGEMNDLKDKARKVLNLKSKVNRKGGGTPKKKDPDDFTN